MTMSKADQQTIQSYVDQEHESFLNDSKREIEEKFDNNTLHLDHFHYSVSQKFDFKTRNITKKKAVYVFTEAMSDLGLKNVFTIEF